MRVLRKYKKRSFRIRQCKGLKEGEIVEVHIQKRVIPCRVVPCPLDCIGCALDGVMCNEWVAWGRRRAMGCIPLEECVI